MDTTSSWTLVLKNLLPYLKLMFAFFVVVVNKMMYLLGGYILTTFFGRRGTQMRGASHLPFYQSSSPSQMYPLD